MIRFSFLIAALALFTAGCDSNDTGSSDCATGSLTATAAGSAYTAECVTLALSNGAVNVTALTNINGSDGPTQRQITMTIPGAAVGTTNAPFGAIVAYIEGEFDGGRQVSGTLTAGTSGSVTIDELTDSSIKGSFSFSGPESEFTATPGQPGGSMLTGRTVTVTNGSFDVSL